MRTRQARVVGLAVALVGLSLAAASWRFPVIMRLPGIVVVRESPTALRELAAYTYYLHTYLAALEWNPETGLKAFAPAIERLLAAEEPDRLELGRLEWHRGNFAAAIEHLEAHQRERGESETSLFWLALSYLRQAEAVNCLAKLLHSNGTHHAASHSGMCALPLTRHHEDASYSRRAAALFTRLLDEYDSGNRVYRWLLSFACMTTDEFPAGVPERYRIETPFMDQFYGAGRRDAEQRHPELRFQDRAPALGVDTFDAGKGVAVEDFDRDGYLDIVTGGIFDPMRYYRNDRGRGFVDRSQASGLASIRGTHIISAADYDDDGWIDLFVSRPMGSERGDFLLLRNQRDGTFRDVTVEVGLLPPVDRRKLYTLTWASAWGDIDADGDLDLFVANWGFYAAVGAEQRLNPLRGNRGATLYRNDGGRFVDVTEASGLARIIFGRNLYGAAFGDYDNDGDLDLAFTPQWLPGLELARNAGEGRFEATDLIEGGAWGFMTSFLDVNHDGRLDLYMGSTGPAPGVTKQAVFGEDGDRYRTSSALWVQTPDGRFEPREDFFPGWPLATMGTNFGDVNNDGAYDFYVGTGSPEGWLILPNLMYLGVKEDGAITGRTENISMLHGFGTIQKGHGIVFFDFDEDGDQDIYSALGGLWPADRWPNQMFVNESELDATWTKIRLRGRRSNYYGAGARIRVVVETPGGDTRSYHYLMDNKTGFGSAPYLAHLGLDDAVAIRRVEVAWPGATTPLVYAAELEATNVLDEDGSARVTGSPPRRSSPARTPP